MIVAMLIICTVVLPSTTECSFCLLLFGGLLPNIPVNTDWRMFVYLVINSQNKVRQAVVKTTE